MTKTYRSAKWLFLMLTLTVGFLSCQPKQEQAAELPAGFTYVTTVIPDIVIDLRYHGNNNFMGRRVNGYNSPEAILTEAAAAALDNVQQELKKNEMGLKLFDAYRPQQAVNHFKEWAQDHADTLMKQQLYPGIDKKDLFKLGYIAERSGHSRGSTVDVTIIHLTTGEEWDMGTEFDFFGPESGYATDAITPGQTANRSFLRTLMVKNGFKPYEAEWWHFTLDLEPFPDTYYDFPVQ